MSTVRFDNRHRVVVDLSLKEAELLESSLAIAITSAPDPRGSRRVVLCRQLVAALARILVHAETAATPEEAR
jgi:hypothetical protein